MQVISPRHQHRRAYALTLAALFCCVGFLPAGDKIRLKDGRTLEGHLGRLASMSADRFATPAGDAPQPKLIVFCDTGLKRVFVPSRQVQEVLQDDTGEIIERFHVKQRSRGHTHEINNVGAVLRVDPFDEFGRRIYAIPGPKGPIEVVQGITLITPEWTKVEGISRYKWDMRIATSSIPPAQLKRIIARVIDPKNIEHRLQLARFLIQSERYGDAKAELDQILKDFPDRKDLKAQVARVSRDLTQMRARRILDEIELRREAGQHRLVYRMLEGFPAENVAGAILQRVRELINDYRNENERAKQAFQEFHTLLDRVPDADRRALEPMRDEIFVRRSALITADVTNWVRLAGKIVQQAQTRQGGGLDQDQVVPSPGRRIVQLLPNDAKKSLVEIALNGQADAASQQKLMLALNNFVIRDRDFYSADDFADVVLNEEARGLLARNREELNRGDVMRLNRRLLEAAYPDEIKPSGFAGMSMNTLLHLEAFLQLVNDPKLNPQEKLALAVSGWLMGSNSASTNLPIATSLWEVRKLVREYLNEPLKLNRDKILLRLRTLEGATPNNIAKLLANMPPTTPTLPQDVPGFFELTVPTPSGGTATYFVQLPLEYDPYNKYPAVMTLNGAGTVPAQSVIQPPKKGEARPSQIDWWAGPIGRNGYREMGQSVRQGYIVIAPAWSKPGQRQYDYSVEAHATVLAALRDACRRFAIDTDRVFLSGHGMGGDAAWDIGMAHPDLWAGVIPFVGISDRYCAFNWQNADTVPFYCVGGEFDSEKIVRNAREWDRMMTRGYDLTIVEYLGRGHEHFADEILDIFEWMNRRKRQFHPTEFEVRTMRPSDNFFWWAEISGFPENAVVRPNDFPVRGKRPITLECRVNANNGIWVKSGAQHVTLWLSPEIVDLNKPVPIKVDGRRINRDPFLKPDIAVMLEDARTRGDRQHPFWVRVDNSR